MTIQTLVAYRNHPLAPPSQQELYCFDAPEHGLVAEPFVESATAAIRTAMEWCGADWHDPPSAVELRFSDTKDDLPELCSTEHPVLLLDMPKPQDDGHRYCYGLVHPESVLDAFEDDIFAFDLTCWLCPALLKYFEHTPQQIYVRVTGLPGHPPHSLS